MCTGHDHSSPGIEIKGQRSRLALGLGCQYETQEGTFLVHFLSHVNTACTGQLAIHLVSVPPYVQAIYVCHAFVLCENYMKRVINYTA